MKQESRRIRRARCGGPARRAGGAQERRGDRDRRRAVARQRLPATRRESRHSRPAGEVELSNRRMSPSRRDSTMVRRADGSGAGCHCRIVGSVAGCGQLRTTIRLTSRGDRAGEPATPVSACRTVRTARTLLRLCSRRCNHDRQRSTRSNSTYFCLAGIPNQPPQGKSNARSLVTKIFGTYENRC